jgi:GT2 family glycosyltransferase
VIYVIIPTYNSATFIGDCLSSLFSDQTHAKRIIVVDDCSTDATADIAHKFDVIFLRQRKRLGFAGNNNTGIRYALSDKETMYIVLLNSDTLVTPDWLNQMLKEMNSDTKVGIVGPKTLKFDKKSIDTTGHNFHYRLGAAENRGSGELDRGQYDHKTDVLGVQFSCALLRREMVERVGLLDEKMFLYVEDVDYCIRARICGWKAVYCPASLIYHYGGGSGVNTRRWMRRYGYSNRLRLVLKDYESIKWGLFGFAFCILAMLASLAKGNGLGPPYAYAFIWNVLNLPIKERSEIQRSRIYDDSVISRYGVGGKRWWHW